MLGSDLLTRANYGHMMAQFAFNATTEQPSVEEETSRVLSSMHAKQAPVTDQTHSRPVEQSNNLNGSAFREEAKDPTKKVGPDGKAYTDEENEEIETLEERDADVKRHEQAHFQAGGKYASPPKYEYQTGPDGKRYAVGGSVDIDMSEVPDDPQATLEKARVIKRAALAPEDPSAQDRKVARQADHMATDAQRQISEEQSSASKEVVAGMPAAQEKAPARSLDEIATEGIVEVATESLEIDPVEQFAFDMVHRFRTSRLQMSNFAGAKTETLSSPGQGFQFRGRGLSFDHYA